MRQNLKQKNHHHHDFQNQSEEAVQSTNLDLPIIDGTITKSKEEEENHTSEDQQVPQEDAQEEVNEELPKEEQPLEQAPNDEAPKKEVVAKREPRNAISGFMAGVASILHGDNQDENGQPKKKSTHDNPAWGLNPGPTPETSGPESETDDDEASQYAGMNENENETANAVPEPEENTNDLLVQETAPKKNEDVATDLALHIPGKNPARRERMRVAAKNASKSAILDSESELYDYGEDESIMSEFHTPIVNVSHFKETKLPANIAMESEEGRQFIFKRIVHFEELRCRRFAYEIADVATFWRGALEVLQAGIFETARAERLIRGTAMMNQAYGEAMQAIFDDVYIDDDGNTVADGWKQTKLKQKRGEEFYTIDPVNLGTNSPKRGEAGKQSAVPGRSVLLDSTIHYQSKIAEKFRDNSERLFDDVVSELTGLRRELKNLLVALKRMGDVYVKDMEAAEQEVLTSFAAYEDIGATPIDFSNPLYNSNGSVRNWSNRGKSRSRHGLGGLLGGSFHGKKDGEELEKSSRRGLLGRIRSNHGSRHGENASTHSGHGSIRGGSTHGGMSVASESSVYNSGTQIGNSLRSVNHIRDGWLAELLYRAAVNHQAEIWEKCGAELSKILKKMQILEMNRRIKLHQLLLDFVPRQRRLYLSLAPVPGPVLVGLVDLRKDHEVLREEVEESIKRRQEMHLQKDQGHRSMYLNRSRATQPKLESSLANLNGDKFNNGLLRAAKILERKTGIRAQWKVTLAIVTSDQFLHLFDISMLESVKMGDDAEGVFRQLLPEYDMPTLESEEEVIARSHSLLKYLIPTDSVYLMKCSGVVDSGDPRQFEVMEAVAGLLTANSSRRLVLRCTGREEAQQWLSLMRGPAGPVMITKK